MNASCISYLLLRNKSLQKNTNSFPWVGSLGALYPRGPGSGSLGRLLSRQRLGPSDLELGVLSKLWHMALSRPQFLTGCWVEASVFCSMEFSRELLTTWPHASLRLSERSKERENMRIPTVFYDLNTEPHASTDTLVTRSSPIKEGELSPTS